MATDEETLALYRSMDTRWLLAFQEAFFLDRRNDTTGKNFWFCTLRLQIIAQVLAERGVQPAEDIVLRRIPGVP